MLVIYHSRRWWSSWQWWQWCKDYCIGKFVCSERNSDIIGMYPHPRSPCCYTLLHHLRPDNVCCCWFVEDDKVILVSRCAFYNIKMCSGFCIFGPNNVFWCWFVQDDEVFLVSRCAFYNTDEGVAVPTATRSQRITERRNKWSKKKNNSNNNKTTQSKATFKV